MNLTYMTEKSRSIRSGFFSRDQRSECAIPGVEIFQLTDRGVTLQATLQGSKFWIDEDCVDR